MPVRINNLVVSVESDPKTGKTTFLYTAPPPIVGFQWDLGIEGLYGNYAAESGLFEGLEIEELGYNKGRLNEYKQRISEIKPNEILVFNLPGVLQIDPGHYTGCEDVKQYHQELLRTAQNTAAVRSVVEDTMTMARELFADAHLESVQRERNKVIASEIAKGRQQDNIPEPRTQLLQIEYAKPNNTVKDIFNTTKGAGKNLIASHWLTDERERRPDRNGVLQEVLTGRKILQGYAGTYKLIDIAMKFEWSRLQDPLSGNFLSVVRGTYRYCRLNMELEERSSLINPTWDSLMENISMTLKGRVILPTRRETMSATAPSS